MSKGKKKSRKLLIAVIVMALLVVLLGTTIFMAYGYVEKKAKKMDIVETAPKEFCVDSKVAKDLKDYRNIAILGIDARKSEGFDGSRSDGILVASIKESTGEVKIFSVMRDTYLLIRDQNKDLILDKITHAHAFGGGINTCSALNKALDLNISEFIIFNWQSVADTVDSMGGIKVKIAANEINDLNKYGNETARNVGGSYTAIYKTGTQTLDGVQAATYCRIRKTSGGDAGRANRMRKVMKALLSKTKDMKLSKLNKVADKLLPEVRTNLKTEDVAGLLTGLTKYKLVGNTRFPYKYYGGIINGVWYGVPSDLEHNVEKLHKIVFGQKEYKLSKKASKINKLIIRDTGIKPGDENEK